MAEMIIPIAMFMAIPCFTPTPAKVSVPLLIRKNVACGIINMRKKVKKCWRRRRKERSRISPIPMGWISMPEWTRGLALRSTPVYGLSTWGVMDVLGSAVLGGGGAAAGDLPISG